MTYFTIIYGLKLSVQFQYKLHHVMILQSISHQCNEKCKLFFFFSYPEYKHVHLNFPFGNAISSLIPCFCQFFQSICAISLLYFCDIFSQNHTFPIVCMNHFSFSTKLCLQSGNAILQHTLCLNLWLGSIVK